MLPSLLLKGWMIGFSIAMPVGPVGLLCIRNSLTYGMICGLISGLGAACADAIYGALAGFGVTAVSDFLSSHWALLQCMGALFLCYLGITTFYAKSGKMIAESNTMSRSRIFLSTFLLTLTNPLTILSFAGVYAGLGIGSGSTSMMHALVTTVGVFIGSAVWWLILSFAASFFKEKMNEKASIWLNRLSGSVIFGFGIIALVTGL